MSILGLPVHTMTMEKAIQWILEKTQGEGASIVLTTNPELLVRARKERALAEIIEKANLSLPDGAGVLLAAKLLGYNQKDRVTGIDLTQRLLEIGSREGLSFYFLGGRPGIAKAAAERMKELCPSLIVLGAHHGYLEHGEEEVLSEINRLKPHILLVGMGAPRQEIFLYSNRERMEIKVGITVGGSFDVLSGSLKRAPQWMMSLHIEWLYRLFQEPSRWRRMLSLPQFLYLVLREGKREL